MKRTSRLRFCLPTLLILAFLAAGLWAQTPDRFFDTAGAPAGQVRLVIFYPSLGTITDLVALKDNGLFPADKLEVIGVYHEKEKTNYQAAIRYAQNNNLTWLKFHRVSAELSPQSLFRKNACSPEFETIFKKSDGIIFFGGPDIPPAVYGQKTNLLTGIEDPYRHFFELSCIFHLLGGSQNAAFKGLLESRPDFPILGICLGSQSLNVGTGGTMIQDIWSEVYGKKFLEDVVELGQPDWHTNPHRRLHPENRALLSYMLHPIQLNGKGKFCIELGFKPDDQPYIMSAHHQMADKLGKGFRVAATSLDGKVTEAIEHERYPNVLGVQFHPEFSMLWTTEPKHKFTPHDRDMIAIKPFLESHAPSFEFHKKLWAWFLEKLQAGRSR
ncbi:MAG: gamma-glutamyl-gamma-aminobutyrate hydrolase family protein [Candidatus Aminicenantes bacterium]|nr:gamma-glutamyl-gamma-aminobutyrate hydrolase family protein [Candidatus Aminicenantes bacterium]